MTIFDRIRSKAQSAFQNVGNFIDRDKAIPGVQLAQGGLGNKINQWQQGNVQRAQATMLPQPFKVASDFAQNRIIQPALDVPQNLNTALNPFSGASLLNRGVAGLMGVGGLVPGIDDVGFGAFDALKAKLAGADPTQAFTGEEYAGLGTALTGGQDGSFASILNMAELPLLLAVGGIKNIDNAKGAISGIDTAKGAIKGIDDAPKFIQKDKLKATIKGLDEVRKPKIPEVQKPLFEPKPVSKQSIFDPKDIVENDENLALFRRIAENPTSSPETRVLAQNIADELEGVIQSSRPKSDLDKPGYLQSLAESEVSKPKVRDIDRPDYLRSLEKTQTPISSKKPLFEPKPKQEVDLRTTTQKLKDVRSGKTKFSTPEEFGKSVKTQSEALKKEHAPLDNLLKKIDSDDGKQHFADIIQKGVKPKNEIYEKAVKLYKKWTDNLADIEDLKSSGKLRQKYHAAVSQEQIIGKELGEVFGGLSETLFDLPHLKEKTDLDFIGDSTLSETFDFRTKGSVLSAHSKATLPISSSHKIIQDFKQHLTKQLTGVSKGEKIDAFDIIGKFQEQFKGTKKKITTKFIATLKDKPHHTLDMVMKKIDKGGGRKINELYRKVRDSNILKGQELKKLEGMTTTQKINHILGDSADFGKRSKFSKVMERFGEEKTIAKYLDAKYRKKPIADLIEEVGKYEFEDSNVKGVINTFINDEVGTEFAKRNLLSKIKAETVNTVVTAHLGLNPVTAVKQLFEINRAPVYAGFKSTGKGILKALNPFSDVDTKYGLKEFSSNYTPKKTNLLKSFPDKVRSVLFLPMEKAELFKNRVFALAMEDSLKNAKGSDIDKLHKVRDVLFGGGNVAHKFNKPLVLKGSELADAMALYFQFSMKNFDLKLDAVQNNELKQFSKLMVSDLVTVAQTTVLFGYPLKWSLENLLPVGTPVLGEVFTKLYETFKQQGIASESKKPKDKEKARFYTSRALTQNIFPAGTEITRLKEAKEISDKGADFSPTGYKRYDAPKDLKNRIKMFAFGRTSTDQYKEYRKELDASGWTPPETPGGIKGLKLAGKGILNYFTGFEIGKAKATDEKPALSNSIEERTKAYRDIRSILNSGAEYSDEQKKELIESAGASVDDFGYYNLASKDKDVKLQEILPSIENMSQEERVKFLMQGRKVIAGQQLITSGMLTYLYERDYITKQQKDAINALKWDEINNEPYVSKSYKGVRSKLTYAKAKKLFKFKTPKLKELKSVSSLLKNYLPGTSQRVRGGEKIIEKLLKAK